MFWIPLLAVAVTGVAFAFPNLKSWYENVTPAGRGAELWVVPESGVSDAPAGREPLSLDDVVARFDEQLPDRTLISFAQIPSEETAIYQVWNDRGFGPWTREGGGGNTLTALDQYSGEVVYDATPEEGNASEQLWSDWSFPLHTGDFGGWVTRLLWVVVGLAPVVLGVTGLTMNLLRRRKRSAFRAGDARPTGDSPVATTADPAPTPV